MSECLGCAADLPVDARFCPACGISQSPPPCANCGAILLPGARFCMACGAPRGSPTSEVSARRVISVLFGDLVGFTTISEGRDHEEVRELLTRYFEEARRVVGRYGGTIEKFIGDAVMAVWGVPTAHEDDAERAVRAGLELVAAVAALSDEIAVPELDIRIGVVTGEVAVTIGAAGQGMVAGDAVNTASRVQSVATPGQVWVDETTRLLTHAAITYADAGSPLLKGKSEPTPLWSVRAVVANVGGAQRADGLEARLIGRDRELRLVKELYHRTEETRQPAMLVVSADPGLGKTRLGWEFSKYSDGLSGTVRWLEGRCLSYGDSVAYYALAEALRGRLRSLRPEADADSGPGDLRALLDLGLATFVADQDERDWMRPRLAVLLLGSTAAYQQEDLFAAWIAFLQRLAGDAAVVVLMIDDAQHADEGFLAFLEQALQTDGLPLYVLLLARRELLERHTRMATNRRVSVLGLSPLSDAEMAELVGGLVNGLPDGIREGLVRRADGVPLFAMETVRSMIDHDLVVPRGGQYVLLDPELDLDAIGAPASLHALIAARLDTLAPELRVVVDHASVLGQEFSRENLTALRGDRPGDLDTILDALVHRQIFSRESNPLSGGFGRYLFVQDVVRATAYGMLARRDRRAAHLRVADHLGDGTGELAPLVAGHLVRAAEAVPNAPDVPELHSRARDLLIAAALRTLGTGVATGAVEQLTMATELCDDDVSRARVETLLARAYGTERDFTQQELVASRALAVLDAAGVTDVAAEAAGHLGFAYDASGRPEAAIALMRPRWEEMVARQSDSALCLVGRYLILALQHAGRHDEIMPVALTTMGAAERTGDTLATLRLLEAMASWAMAKRLNRLAQGLADLLVVVTADTEMGTTEFSGPAIQAVQQMGRDLPEARRRIQLVDDLIERNRLVSARGWMTLDRLLLDLAAGNWAGVDAEYDGFADLVEPPELGTYAFIGMRVALARGQELRPDWIDSAQAAGDDPDATLGALLARGQWLAGARDIDAELAARVVERARIECGSEEFVFLCPDCLDLTVAAGSIEDTRALLALLPRNDADRSIDVAVRGHRARARALLAALEQEEPAVIEAHLREAISAYDAWGGHLWARRTAVDLAALLDESGHGDEAQTLRAAAGELYAQLGADAWLGELNHSAGRLP